MYKTFLTVFAALALVAWAATGVLAVDPNANQPQTIQQPAAAANQIAGGAQVSPRMQVFRDSDLRGMKVQNQQGEDLGKIEDLVIDVQTGQIKYAALSFGTTLGMGGKLFAVPWRSFRLEHNVANDKNLLVLNVSKEALQSAPGFDKSHWPDFANPQWASEIERHYSTAEHPTTTQQR